MAYRFEDDETLAAGLARVASETLEIAILALRVPSAEGVHDARTSLKRARALLRLVRPTLGEPVFTEQNDRLRAIGRTLSAARDAVVLVQVLDELRERSPEALGDRVYEELRERFVVQREAASVSEATRVATVAALVLAKESIAKLTIEDRGFRAIEPGLRALYAAGLRRLKRSRRRPEDARLHALRKRVKDLTYLVALLEPIWPPVLLGMHETLKRLGDRLGENRDLALLRAALAKEAFLLPDELAPLNAAIDARRALLGNKAIPLAQRLFAERPRRFTARLGAYWDAWRAPQIP